MPRYEYRSVNTETRSGVKLTNSVRRRNRSGRRKTRSVISLRTVRCGADGKPVGKKENPVGCKFTDRADVVPTGFVPVPTGLVPDPVVPVANLK